VTVGYISPENIESYEYTPAGDVWGSGIILYRLIYKKHPFEKGKNVLDVVRLLSGKIDFPETDAELVNVLKGLLNLVWGKDK
jgi:serine/threonine protein kinase